MNASYPGVVLATSVVHLTWAFVCNQNETDLADKAIICVIFCEAGGAAVLQSCIESKYIMYFIILC